MEDEEETPSCGLYMDCHTHMLEYGLEVIRDVIIANARDNGVRHIVANTVIGEQFFQLINMANRYPQYLVPGFGIHPGYVGRQQQMEKLGDDNKLSWVDQLEAVLNQSERYSVGEIGLDFRTDVIQLNPKEMQIGYFKKQMEIAVKMGRPMTIHCVRAYGEMLKLLKVLNKNMEQISSAKPHIIMHCYGGDHGITRALLKLTNIVIYFSLSLKYSSALLEIIPKERLICETDSPFQNNIQLLQQYDRVSFNKYYLKIKQSMDKEGSSDAIEKMDTNEPVKVITNVKSIAKYFKIDEIELSKIIYKNSLKAFKLIK